MKSKTEVKIELTAKASVDIMNMGTREIIDLNHPPYEEFSVVFGTEKISEDYIETAIRNNTNTEIVEMFKGYSDKEIDAFMNYYNNDRDIEVVVKVEPNKVIIKVLDWSLILNTNSPVFHLKEKIEGIDISVDFETTNKELEIKYNQSEQLRTSMMTYMFGVLGLISFMQGDKETILKPRTKLQIEGSKKKGKGKNKSNKTYIYKKRYVIDDSIMEQLAKSSEREYHRKVDQWIRRGHWTTLRNGKRVWREPQICNAKESTGNKRVKEYKITTVK